LWFTFRVITGYPKPEENQDADAILPVQTKYLKLMSLQHFAGKDELLLHPLIQLFLLRKMQKLNVVVYFWIIMKVGTLLTTHI